METTPSHSNTVRAWLIACIALVICMIAVGGLTRLTESGLSIVEWKLVTGILPPLSEAGWQAEFDAYSQTPEFQHKNKWMTAEEFKNIYWLEYIHRLLGRLAGLVFILPFIYFWARKQLTPPIRNRMLSACLLVAVQGAVGWYMVKSGLVDVPWVSPYRLAFHLGLAVAIFILLLHTLLIYKRERPTALHIPSRLYTTSLWITAAIYLQILLGALVAGLDAGLTYNTFPLMDGKWIPDGLWQLEPLTRNLFENVTTVQFQHRWFAIIVALLLLAQHRWLLKVSENRALRHLSWAIIATVALQLILGITTLLLVVPIPLASLHQIVAIALIGLCVTLNHMLHWRCQVVRDSSTIQPDAIPER